MFLPETFPETALLKEVNIAEMRFTTRVQSILPADYDASEIEQSILLYFQQILGGEVIGTDPGQGEGGEYPENGYEGGEEEGEFDEDEPIDEEEYEDEEDDQEGSEEN